MNNSKSEDFDQKVMEQLSDIIPREEDVIAINPWSRPIGYIIWGCVFSLINLNVYYLQYLFPTIGTVLYFLGFRSLRNENKYFKATWILSILNLFLRLFLTMYVASPLIGRFKSIALGSVFFVGTVIVILLFRKALHEVFRKVDKKPRRDPLLSACIWIIVFFLIAITPFSYAWQIVLVMFALFIFILCSLFRVSRDMDEIGYVMSNAPVKISNRMVIFLYLILTLIAVGVCCLFSNHLRLEGTPYSKVPTSDAREVLIEKGFPEEILPDLKEKDIELFLKARKISVYKEILHFQESGTQYDMNYINESENHGLKSVMVFIELDNKEMYVLNYFKWINRSAYWQDAIMLDVGENVENLELVDSGLFYDKNGNSYSAPFPWIEVKNETYGSLFLESTSLLICGSLNYPFRTINQRGFILYHYSMPLDYLCTPSLLNYHHNSHPFQLPYSDMQNGAAGKMDMFSSNWQQHYQLYKFDYSE